MYGIKVSVSTHTRGQALALDNRFFDQHHQCAYAVYETPQDKRTGSAAFQELRDLAGPNVSDSELLTAVEGRFERYKQKLP